MPNQVCLLSGFTWGPAVLASGEADLTLSDHSTDKCPERSHLWRLIFFKQVLA